MAIQDLARTMADSVGRCLSWFRAYSGGRILVVQCLLLHECLKHLLFALVDRLEFLEVSTKLAITVTRAEKLLRIGLPDQFAVAPAILPPKDKKGLVVTSALGAVAVRFAALARNHRHASDRHLLHGPQPLQEQAALELEFSQRYAQFCA